MASVRRERPLIRTAGRPADVAAFEEAVVGFFADAAELLGQPKSVAAIYGLCVASPEPLEFSDLQERLDLSVGSISQGIGVLRKIGAIKVAARTHPSTGEIETPGSSESRRRYKPRSRGAYAPALEPCKVIEQWIADRLEQHVNSEQRWLHGIANKLPEGTATKGMRDRVKSLQEWHEKSCDLLWVAKSFGAPSATASRRRR